MFEKIGATAASHHAIAFGLNAWNRVPCWALFCFGLNTGRPRVFAAASFQSTKQNGTGFYQYNR